jgi:hypothetical protein
MTDTWFAVMGQTACALHAHLERIRHGARGPGDLPLAYTASPNFRIMMAILDILANLSVAAMFVWTFLHVHPWWVAGLLILGVWTVIGTFIAPRLPFIDPLVALMTIITTIYAFAR